MKLEIRNLSSSASYTIDPDGAVLGREGSKADIILRDQAVSKKHAKIYEKNGKWYLEDLASSNGTFLENRRITEPVILTPGSVFALSENQFEVVQIVNGKAALDMDTDAQDPPANVLDDLPPLGMTPGDSVDGEGKRSRPMRSTASRVPSPAQAGSDPADLGDEGAEKQGFGYFVVAVPKAIAYYMAAVPLMALNPVGSIRKSIENQKLPAMGPFPLTAYGIPVNVFSSAIGVIVGMIALLINGTFTFPLIPLIISIVIAIVASAIGGFILHPLGKLVINRWLKGDSDDKSRTNYYVTMLTATALVAIGNGIGGIIGAIPVPFINVLPQFIVLAGSMITFFVLYSWMKHFNVVAWFQKVLMVLGVLILVSGAWGVIQQVLHSINMLGSGGSGVNMAAAGAAGDLTAEQKAALEAAGVNAEEAAKRAQEAMEKAGVANADVQEQMKKAMAAAGDPANAEALVKQAQENAKAMQAAAEKNAAAAMKEAEKAAAATEKVEKTAKEKEAEKEDVKKPAEKEKPVLAAAPAEDEEEEKEVKSAAMTANNSASGPSPGFQEFIQQRKEVDDAIEKDPTLLKKKDVLASYEKYLRKTYEVRAKWKKKKAKDDAGQKINDRLKDIEVYEETGKMVQELHKKIFR